MVQTKVAAGTASGIIIGIAYSLALSLTTVSLSSFTTLASTPAFAASRTPRLALRSTRQHQDAKSKHPESNFREHIFHGTISALSSQGERQLLEAKYDDAAASFHKALNKNPKDISALDGLGLALAMTYKLDGADEQFDKALKLNPNDPLAHVGKASVKLYRLQTSNMDVVNRKSDILKAAEADCDLALQQDPEMPEAYLTLGMIKKEQGLADEAIANYTKAIQGDARFGAAYTRRGLSFLDRGDHALAEQDFKQALNFRTSDAAAHFGLGRIYLSQGQNSLADKELNTALSLNRNSAPIHIARGDLFGKQGNIVAALKEYNAAVAIKAENAAAYMRIADIYEDRGDLEMSLAELRSGLMLNPDSDALHARIADTNLRLEKLDNAIKEYNAALALKPGDAKAVMGLTRAYVLKSQKAANGAYFTSNDFEDAEAQIQQAIKLNPNDLELRLADAKLRAISGRPVDLSTIGTPTNDAERVAYAEALLAQLKYTEAAQQMKVVIDHQNDPKQLCALADMSLLIHDLQTASSAYRKASTMPGGAARAKRGLNQVAKDMGDAQKSLNLANDLARRKQLASGIDNYVNAAYLNPRLPDAHRGLADALAKYYEKEPARLREAAAQYQAYISLAPNLPDKEREHYQKTAIKCEERASSIERSKGVKSM